MKSVLCFGDSNVYGQVPLRDFVKRRYPAQIRWTGRLQVLGQNLIHVIEEGCNGRTTALDDPVRAGRDGLAYLAACLDSHVPLDWVVLMLGTNDLKKKFDPTPESITARMQQLVRLTKTICSAEPKATTQILLISPVVIKPEFYIHGDFDYGEAETYSIALAPLYAQLALDEGTQFLDAGTTVEASDADGCHLDEFNQGRLADAIWQKLQPFMKNC